ncbi:MAG TPA: hypothetical protein VG759_29610 [Candidatus Angelobacter sp.]|nr:hypothetical protein [Candidatus Angelobacter sp.]
MLFLWMEKTMSEMFNSSRCLQKTSREATEHLSLAMKAPHQVAVMTFRARNEQLHRDLASMLHSQSI